MITLKKGGKNCICPFKTKFLIPQPHRLDPNKLNMALQEFECNSDCMFFTYLPKTVFNPNANSQPDAPNIRHNNSVLLECTKSTFMVDDDGNII